MRSLSELRDLVKALAPGQPAPPKPIKKRAPRPESPFDPLEGAKHSSAPYQFRPHRLKDLWQLHKLDAYEPSSVKNVKIRRYVAAMKQAAIKPKVGFPSVPSMRILKSFIAELKCTE
jgi:hypothetical protein